ncbi:MAG: S8 family serine peptidase [Myxococcales bacterium]|nr:S8 family serine peptidase [Myxococcales bacterium]
MTTSRGPLWALAVAILVSSVGAAVPVAAQLARPPAPERFVPVQDGPTAPGHTLLPYASERFLVKLRPEAMRRARVSGGASIQLDSFDALGRDHRVRRVRPAYRAGRDPARRRARGVDRWHIVELDRGEDIPAVVARYAADADVEAASLDWRAYPSVIPTDPLHPNHWGHNNTGQFPTYCWGCGGHGNGAPVGAIGFDAAAEAAWDQAQGFGNASVVIAIIDTGVDSAHPDLRQVPGWDYGSGDGDPNDDSGQAGHGTACAGVAAAVADNALGAAGAAGGVSIMPLKVANDAGDLFFSAIQDALYHATDNGADIVSMSLGSSGGTSAATDAALQYAYDRGLVLFASTGNDNDGSILYPASHATVIGVGAASPCGERKRSSSNTSDLNPGVNPDPNGYSCDGERWWGSNYGTNTPDAAGAVDLIAPTIMPTTDVTGNAGYASGDTYLWFNGTSAAAPYAAGVAALLLSANPNWTPTEIRQALLSSAADVVSVESGPGWDRYTGYGMVNAAAALTGGGGPPAHAPLPYATGFETGALDAYWSTNSNAEGRVQVTSANGPSAGSFHVTLDDSVDGSQYSTNEAWLRLDLSGETQVDLSFDWKEFGDETHAEDGVYFSDDGGSTFVKVFDLAGQATQNNSWQSFTLAVDQLATSAGLALTDTFVVKFQQYDNYGIANDGFAFDEIAVQ